MTKKRTFFYIIITFLLITFSLIITNTADLILLDLILIFLISFVFYILFRLWLLFLINKNYSNLIETVNDIEKLKMNRYKTYFIYSDAEIEKEVNFWNDCIKTAYEYSDLLIESLKYYSNYLSNKKYYDILVIEEKIRNTSRT